MKTAWKIAIALPVAYLSAMAVCLWRVDQARDETEAEVKKLAHLGDESGSDLRNGFGGTATDRATLEKACAEKLEPGERNELLSYFAPYDPRLDDVDDRSDPSEPHVFLPRREFEGLSPYGWMSENADDAHYASLATVFGDLATDMPWRWGWVMDTRGHRELHFDRVRYLVVSIVRAYMPVRFEARSRYSGGVAILASRVVEAASGETLCEGSVNAEIASSVLAHQPSQGNAVIDDVTMRVIAGPEALESAFSRAIRLAPLRAVCGAAREGACEQIQRELAPAKERSGER